MINLLKIKTGSALKAPAGSLPYGRGRIRFFFSILPPRKRRSCRRGFAVPYPVFLYAYAVSRTLSCNHPGHTLKSQVVVDKKSKAVICTNFSNGKKQDFKLVKESRIRWTKERSALTDSG